MTSSDFLSRAPPMGTLFRSALNTWLFSSAARIKSVLVDHGDVIGAKQIVKSASQQPLNVLACDGLHHPEASLEVGIEVSPDMHLALPAGCDRPGLAVRIGRHCRIAGRKRSHSPAAGFLKLPLDVRHSRHAISCFKVSKVGAPTSIAASVP